MTYCPSGYFDYESIDNFCQMNDAYEYCWLCNVDSSYETYYSKCEESSSGSSSYGSYGSSNESKNLKKYI